ncbi:zinc finger protein ZAT9-like [Vicia villosa]|uniref:zinc finger protein ZAT9-like n=1 Tax=Vicia villosa TaxID=3911 RepID=UPI00273BBA0E|nr:zinc finger protein ZAT9-like [Vicia villosa]
MEKNNGKVCWICDKWFSNGKAIGGHMRSHYGKLPMPPANSTDLTQHPISASSLTCYPEKNQTENVRPMKRDFSAISANSNRGDGSAPYPQNPTRKRSKCHRQLHTVADRQAADALCLLSEGEPKSGGGESLAQADSQTRFKCDRCGKMFQSYQALGGHKANHSKTKNLDLGDGYPHSC